MQSPAEAARCNTVALCRPLLDRLMAVIGETVDLSVLRQGQMVFVDQVHAVTACAPCPWSVNISA